MASHSRSNSFQDSSPWRRKIRYERATEADIQALIERLSFIKNKTKWGAAFRFGFFEINKSDFTYDREANDAALVSLTRSRLRYGISCPGVHHRLLNCFGIHPEDLPVVPLEEVVRAR